MVYFGREGRPSWVVCIFLRIQQRAGTKAGPRDIVGTTVKLVLLVPPIQSFALTSALVVVDADDIN